MLVTGISPIPNLSRNSFDNAMASASAFSAPRVASSNWNQFSVAVKLKRAMLCRCLAMSCCILGLTSLSNCLNSSASVTTACIVGGSDAEPKSIREIAYVFFTKASAIGSLASK